MISGKYIFYCFFCRLCFSIIVMTTRRGIRD